MESGWVTAPRWWVGGDAGRCGRARSKTAEGNTQGPGVGEGFLNKEANGRETESHEIQNQNQTKTPSIQQRNWVKREETVDNLPTTHLTEDYYP